MKPRTKALRPCLNGHDDDMITDGPTCPIGQPANKPIATFLAKLASPAHNGLEQHGITALDILSNDSKKDILKPNGIGPASLPALK